MGMYDHIYIDYPIPIADYIPSEYRSLMLRTFGEEGFQTKDLDCIMADFHITNSGLLYMDHLSSFEDREQKPKIKQYFHGHMRVYTIVYLDDSNLEEWHGVEIRMSGPEYKDNVLFVEYDLKFTDGLLVEAVMVSPTKERIYELHGSL
jgi:hypothetical protein